MDELTLVARLRDNFPAGIDLSEPERQLAAEIRAASATIPADFSRIELQSRQDHEVQHRDRRRTRAATARRRLVVKLVAVGAVAAVAAAAAVIALQNVPARPVARPGASPNTSADARGVQLASYAAMAAASEPAWRPDEWIYGDRLLSLTPPKPGAQNPMITWTQVDEHQFAYYQDGKLVIRNQVPFLRQGTSVFERPVTEGNLYSYLLSLPTTPAALRAVIVHNLRSLPRRGALRTGPFAIGTGNYGVWAAIEATLDTTILPPKLLAAVYGILATDPVVHFDKSVTDNAGQTGVGFYSIKGAWKSEIMINPSTYAYMGDESVALASQTWHVRMGKQTVTRTIKKGQGGWTDLVASGIVQHPGQKP
jgi:hypothetical protein